MPNKINKRLLFSIATFVTLICASYLIWFQSTKSHNLWIKQQTTQAGNLASQKFQSIVKNDIERLINLKKRIEHTNGDYFKNWQYDAEMLIEQNPSFNFLEWIDSTMVIRSIFPLKGNEKAINLDISKVEFRKEEWKRRSTNNSVNFTEWTSLVQGGKSFLVDVPVSFDGRFQGTISASVNFTSHFDKLSKTLSDFTIKISDHKDVVFYQHNKNFASPNDTNLIYQTSILIDENDNQNWLFTLYPSTKLLSNKRVDIINYIFIFSILLALLFSLLVYFYMSAKMQTKKARKSNAKLSKANAILNTERNRAEKASKAKTDFLSNMSHEIRTPLHAILGFIGVLKDSKLDEAHQVYIDLMDKSSVNLLSIINDILEIDKIESGNVKLEEIYFNPSIKVRDTIDVYRFHFAEKKLNVNSNFITRTGTYVIGDQNKFLQIIINILKNALKFTDKGAITVNYKEHIINNLLKVVVSIEDTGAGIHENKIKSIFNRFSQVDDSVKKQHEGSGLGLAISQDLAKLLGGSITVESEFNKGSNFTITTLFKIAEDQNRLNNTFQSSFKNVSLSHLNVLAVDDNKMNIIVLKKLLQDIDINVDVADNGSKAVNMVKEGNYQLVLMDIHMPVMDGFEATKLIRKQNTELIIFGLSANVTTEAIAKALDSGMNNYITKPFSKELLYELILNYFG